MVMGLSYFVIIFSWIVIWLIRLTEVPTVITGTSVQLVNIATMTMTTVLLFYR